MPMSGRAGRRPASVTTISSPDFTQFPSDVTIFTNFGSGAATGNVLGFFYVTYGDQTLGVGENPGYPRPEPPYPPPAQLANMSSATTDYNITTSGTG
jgi:hypothetical protein